MASKHHRLFSLPLSRNTFPHMRCAAHICGVRPEKVLARLHDFRGSRKLPGLNKVAKRDVY